MSETFWSKAAAPLGPKNGLGGIEFSVLCACALMLASPLALAQPTLERAERLPEFGRAVASVEDTAAIVVNPANLAFMQGAEFRWAGVFLDDATSLPYNGHALGLGVKIPTINLSAAMRLDMLYPPEDAADTAVDDYKWLTWALAIPIGSGAAFGASIQRSYSDGALADDLTSVSLGVTSRMADWLALSLVGHHINRPNNRFFEYEPAYTVGIAVRPLTTRALELAFESEYLRDDDTWKPKALLALDVAPIGRLRSEFAVVDPTGGNPWSWQAALGLSIDLNTAVASTEFTAGLVTGTALGASGNYSPYFGVASRGFREPVGPEVGRYGIRLRVDETPDARGHFALLRTLWSIAREPTVDALALTLRAAPGHSTADIEELRDALLELRRRGKRVVCHFDSLSLSGVYLCAAANRIVLSPAGEVRLDGLEAEYVYLVELLDKLGIRAEFIRAGDYKSAPEQVTQRRASSHSRENRINLLQQFEIEVTTALALGRKLSPQSIRQRVADGPYLAGRALDNKLIDAVAFEDELEAQVRVATGRATRLSDDHRAPRSPQTWQQEGILAVVHVEGELIDGDSAEFPLLGVTATGAATIAETLRELGTDRRVKAIVVRVDTPGGSSSASDALWRAVSLSAERKPTIVSMGGVAASGGYYLSSAASRVFANATTVTGSIGVFYGKADVSGLLGKIGIDVETYRTHPGADSQSWLRPLTDRERAAMERQVDGLYDLFVSRVARGRELTDEEVRAVAGGRVWTGRQAVQRQLVDEVGGFRQALEYARRQAGLSEDAEIVELPRRETSLVLQALGLQQANEWQRLSISPQVKSLLRQVAPLAIHPANQAQNRLELNVPELQ